MILVFIHYVENAKELLPDSKFTDDDLLCKFGCTKDFSRRSTEHEKYFIKEFEKKMNYYHSQLLNLNK